MKPGTAIPISVSAGELIDKITILEIKAGRLDDAEKLRHVEHELAMLKSACDQSLARSPELLELAGQLKSINLELWRVEDALRLCEQQQDFGPRFVELARSVYRTNDRRSELKRRINDLVGSSLVEEKSYPPYE